MEEGGGVEFAAGNHIPAEGEEELAVGSFVSFLREDKWIS